MISFNTVWTRADTAIRAYGHAGRSEVRELSGVRKRRTHFHPNNYVSYLYRFVMFLTIVLSASYALSSKLKKRWLAPGGLWSPNQPGAKLRAVYLPFYVFKSRIVVHCT
eukprot:1551344-Pyramimonas_sp.AAC.1